MDSESLKATVRERYGNAALQVGSGTKPGCCGGGSCGVSAPDPITSNLYTTSETAMLHWLPIRMRVSPIPRRSARARRMARLCSRDVRACS